MSNVLLRDRDKIGFAIWKKKQQTFKRTGMFVIGVNLLHTKVLSKSEQESLPSFNLRSKLTAAVKLRGESAAMTYVQCPRIFRDGEMHVRISYRIYIGAVHAGIRSNNLNYACKCKLE